VKSLLRVCDCGLATASAPRLLGRCAARPTRRYCAIEALVLQAAEPCAANDMSPLPGGSRRCDAGSIRVNAGSVTRKLSNAGVALPTDSLTGWYLFHDRMDYSVRCPLQFWKVCVLIRQDDTPSLTAFVLGQEDIATFPVSKRRSTWRQLRSH
jgi:hypothetical protein